MAFTNRSNCENLNEIVRRANIHYSDLARAVRASLHPTHHAKKRAVALQLSVSIQAAKKLDQRQISVLPLPILDLNPSPLPMLETRTMSFDSNDNLTIIAPKPLYPSQVNNDGSSFDVLRPDRPVLRIATSENVDAPHAALANVSCDEWEDPKSRWSATTVGEAGDSPTYSPHEEGDMFMTVEAGATEGDPLLTAEDSETLATLRPRIAVSGSGPGASRHRISLPPHLTRQMSTAPRLDVPVDVGRLSWCSDIFMGPSSGSSRASSSGPVTPHTPDNDPRPTTTFKRKASLCDADEEGSLVLEKRPRFERKPWIAHRRVNSQASFSSSQRYF